jgi:aryl-alcohol dehydrogenase-like predicted oxidoreductase
LQTPLSLLRREYERSLAPALEEVEGAALAYEPLCRGLLSGKYRRLPRFEEGDLRREDRRFWAFHFGRTQPIVERLRRVAAKLGCPPSALAIAWALRRPRVAVALVGAKRPEQVRQNAEASALLDRPQIWSAIDKIFG